MGEAGTACTLMPTPDAKRPRYAETCRGRLPDGGGFLGEATSARRDQRTTKSDFETEGPISGPSVFHLPQIGSQHRPRLRIPRMPSEQRAVSHTKVCLFWFFVPDKVSAFVALI